MIPTYTATQTTTGWTLNDGTHLADTAASPRHIIATVHAHAVTSGETFPVRLNIHPNGKQPIALKLNHNMTTSLITDETTTPVKDADTTSATHTEDKQPQNTDPKEPKKCLPLYLAAATLAGIALAATITAFTLNHETNTNNAAAPNSTPAEETILYTIPADEQIITLTGTTLYTAEETTLKTTDITTGNSHSTQTTIDPAKTRTLTTANITAIDGGEGTVLLIDNTQEPRTLTGTLNARGTAPIIINGTHYTTATTEGTTPENASILAATDTNVLIVKAPATIEYTNDGRSIAIQGPTDTAHITAWIAGNDTRAISTWQDGEQHWLVLTDTTGDGTNLLTHQIPTSDYVKFTKGNITLGDNQALINDQLQPICPAGKWIGTERWCSTPEGTWTYQNTTLTTEPQATTNTHIITNNEVKER
ncbi:hypothetical protein [Rothia nasimurium]|uniref:hypothetical protein n=1 Tax=Rothia nasimurium TaxID=85336 RepID=UPI0016294B86|nr:hypothetical protein [Rothia nasimurium]